MVAVWAKVYVAEVKVEEVWMDNVSAENYSLSTGQHFRVMPTLLLHRHLKEVQSTGYTLVLILHDF